MNIKSIGGEFSLIKKILAKSPTTHINLIQGVGDDAAVIKTNAHSYTLVTTDMLVENTHFKRIWSSAEQIGMKAIECNVSDIAAMGGKPSFIFVSLVLPHNTSVSWVERLYVGLNTACNSHDIILAGGDTTQGELCAINITLLGSVLDKELCLRSHAKPGDYLAVTGYLGGSAAGLKALSMGRLPSDYLFEKHINPKCKLSEALHLNSTVNAMIDISDGLSSEVHHICDRSKTGAELYETKLPIHEEVKAEAKLNNLQASSFAMTGGEDLELLFSFDPQKIKLLDKTRITYHIVGKITKSKKERIFITSSGKHHSLPLGYKHFC